MIEKHSSESDGTFGPGTDLVLSLLAAFLLLFIATIQIFRDEIAALREQMKRNTTWEIRERAQDRPFFEQDSASLTEAAKRLIQSQAAEYLEALRHADFNQLLIEGHASPESPAHLSKRDKEKWNLALSISRAEAVADYLNELKIPYECVSIAGFGRSHSEILGEFLLEQPLAVWDRDGIEAENPRAEALKSERLVRIHATRHVRSVCDLVLEPTLSSRLTDEISELEISE